MRVYTVHFRPGSLAPDRDTTLVKEGFCWPAFLFTFFWALWHRLWLVAALIVAVEIVIEVVLLLAGADEITRLACLLGFRIFIAYGANDWRRAKLTKRGYREAGVVAAPDEDAAVRRFFDLNPDVLDAGRPAVRV